ncbi:3-hydroxyacyl-CoA dehydrogenase [Neisseriaceae bacterium PsAf]|nr:3-hydroxyacyl-CoA dehydrogenase [Neisseriaceae bacterium PsAf]
MALKNVTVLGCGVLGSQIAYQCSFEGCDVVSYDINDEALEKAKQRISALKDSYQKDLHASQEEVDKAEKNITFTSDLAQAVEKADIVIEAVPEVPDIKIDLYKKLADLLPEKTILATNSSTLLPSTFAKETGRPEKYLALHFANHIWLRNTAEIMRHPGTDEKVFQTVIEFAKQIGMVPIPLQKEQPGYVLNSLLVPLLDAGLELWAKGIAEPEVIDKTWMIATGAPMGPFAIIDSVGLRTLYNVIDAKDGEPFASIAEKLKSEYLENKLGIESGEGFYTYPNPAFADKDFLKA